MKDCNLCANYNTVSCMGMTSRMRNIADYDFDCYVSEDDKMICNMMCGYPEDEFTADEIIAGMFMLGEM